MKAGSVAAVAAFAAIAAVLASHAVDAVSSRSAETTEMTNEVGQVTRIYTENNVTTNGTIVTSKKIINLSTFDRDGNLISNTTTESCDSRAGGVEVSPFPGADDFYGFAEFFPERLDDMFEDFYARLRQRGPFAVPARARCARQKPGCRGEGEGREREKPDFSLLGVRLGEPLPEGLAAGDQGAGRQGEAQDGTAVDGNRLVRVKFVPARKIDGIDWYEAGVTPVSRKVAEVCAGACSDNPVGRFGYLLDALEKKYGRDATVVGRGAYQIKVGDGRSVFLLFQPPGWKSGALKLRACDYDTMRLAGREWEELREQRIARENAERDRLVNEAVEAL